MEERTRVVEVTEEEYELLLKLREQLKHQEAAVGRMSSVPGGTRSSDFALGAVAGMAAHWLYQELFEEEEDEEEEDVEDEEEEFEPTAVPEDARALRRRRRTTRMARRARR
jgi:hypothetical protein